MRSTDYNNDIRVLESSQKQIKILLEKHEDGSDYLLQVIDLLAQMGVNTYPFSVCANEVAVELSDDDVSQIDSLLNQYLYGDRLILDENKAFAAFYLITYRHFRYEKIDNYRNALNKYQDLFLKSSDSFALVYQIKARYNRVTGDIKKALYYDKKAVLILKKHGIHNVQVDITYAGTVLKALQDNDSSISSEDITDAVSKVENAIQYNPNVSRYYGLLAKFKMYTLLYRGDKVTPNQYIPVLNEAKVLLNKAIETEDPDMEIYASSVATYKELIREADSILRQIRFNNHTEELLQAKIVQVEKEAKEIQNRYLEILAVFVAIIAVVMALINGISSKFTYNQLIAMIFTFNTGLLAVYATFLILLRDAKKKYVFVIIFCLLLQLFVVAVVNNYIDFQALHNLLFSQKSP